MSKIIYLPRPTRVPTSEGLKEVNQIMVPGTDFKPMKPAKFDEINKKFDETGKIDMQDFNNASEIGAFIDWRNEMLKNEHEKKGNKEIHEITKFVVRTMYEKYI